MKAKLILTALLSFVFYLVSSQVPQGFNYQAIARDNSGNPITNFNLQVKLAVMADSIGSTVYWEELFNPVTTNAYGLFTVVMGRGVRQGTSTVAAFSSIDWTTTPIFLRTQIYYQSAWKNMGTTRLWSVPYALMAKDVNGTLTKLKVNGTVSDMDSALFEVKNKDGQIVFAVYNEGVRIYVDDGVPGKTSTKGGFAIGSFDKSKGQQDYLIVTGDSIRAYIDTGLVKARKGGFAIGSFDQSKLGREEYFRITRDSSRVYINDGSTKSVKGGFAIGGFGTSKSYNSKYISVKPEKTNITVTDSLKGFSVTNVQGANNSDFININKINYAIGHQSGLNTNPNLSVMKGRYNVFFGYQSGFSNTEGYGNIFVGYTSGYSMLTGSYNVFMGFRSGNANLSGNSNVFVGYQSGEKSIASSNVYVGQGAGRYNDAGTRNTYVGCQSGIEDGEYGTPGNDNVYLGYRAGATSFIGNQNVYIGSYAGETNNNYSSGRVFIGYQAGRNEANGNKLYIDNSSSTTPLIYGEFNATMTLRQLTINGKTTTNGSFNYGADNGTANTYVVAIQGITAYVAGMVVVFNAKTANTAAACTLNINSLGAKSLFMKHDQNPTLNFIEAGSIVMAVYDGTAFQMMQPAAN